MNSCVTHFEFVWTACNLVNYPDDECDSGWSMLVMNIMWQIQFTYVHLLVLLCRLNFQQNVTLLCLNHKCSTFWQPTFLICVRAWRLSSIPGRYKRFFSSPKFPDWLWGLTNSAVYLVTGILFPRGKVTVTWS